MDLGSGRKGFLRPPPPPPVDNGKRRMKKAICGGLRWCGVVAWAEKEDLGKVIADHTAPPHFGFKKTADSLLPALSQVDNFQSLSTT